MTRRIRPFLRETSPYLLIFMRLADGAVAALLLPPIVIMYVGYWSEYYTKLVLLAFVMTLLIFHYRDVYRSRRGESYVNEMSAIFAAWAIEAGLLVFLLFVFKQGQYYSRFVLLIWFTVTPLAMFLVHVIIRKTLRLIRARGKNQRMAVIVGAGELGLSLAQYIEEIPWAGIRVIGFFDDQITAMDSADTRLKGKKILGTVLDLRGYLEENDVDFVYIALPLRAEKKIQDILNNCRTRGARLFLVPDFSAFLVLNARFQQLGSLMLLDFNPESRRKRLFDVLFSLLVLAVTLPLTLLIALVIKLSDGGPVLYGHRRITVSGREFLCLKFRTMRVNAENELADLLRRDPAAGNEWQRCFKLKNDPRVTRFGRVLRKTSLDELPQMINVLKGEMSVVGARPVVQQELSDYYQHNGGLYCSIKPGITGLWQVGKRSDTENYQDRVALDTWYALNWNFWLDMKVIGQTVIKILRGNGAY